MIKPIINRPQRNRGRLPRISRIIRSNCCAAWPPSVARFARTSRHPVSQDGEPPRRSPTFGAIFSPAANPDASSGFRRACNEFVNRKAGRPECDWSQPKADRQKNMGTTPKHRAHVGAGFFRDGKFSRPMQSGCFLFCLTIRIFG